MTPSSSAGGSGTGGGGHISGTPTPTPVAPAPNTTQFVFVDEYNRFKRLKVTRACETCRRRKVRCDSSQMNGGPCSSCRRLNVECITPSSSQQPGYPTRDDEQVHKGDQYQIGAGATAQQHGMPPHDFQQQNYPQLMQQQYEQLAQLAHLPVEQFTPIAPEPHQILAQQEQGEEMGKLSDVLGLLNIEGSGRAEYVKSFDKKYVPTMPAAGDCGTPPTSFSSPKLSSELLATRIPANLMPSDDLAMHLFSVYFEQIHPYMPIISRRQFMRQWHKDRDDLSPLLLESILGCAARFTERPAGRTDVDDPSTNGMVWVLRAKEHIWDYHDMPRLATAQASLILLKALETIPQQGLYYRSWLMLGVIVRHAMDLGLNKLADKYKPQMPVMDLMIRRRIWQQLFMLDQMMGQATGREKYIDINTLDLTLPVKDHDLDEKEFDTHSDFIYLVALVKVLRRMSDIYLQLGADWKLSSIFTVGYSAMDEILDAWYAGLPTRLKLVIPDDLDAPLPKFDFHFLPFLHMVYNLCRIVLHRPWAEQGGHIDNVEKCLGPSINLVRIAKATLDQFGLRGFQCSLRGTNFTVYGLVSASAIFLGRIRANVTNPWAKFFQMGIEVLEVVVDSTHNEDLHQQVQKMKEACRASLERSRRLESTPPVGPSPQQGQQQQPPSQQHTPQQPQGRDTTYHSDPALGFHVHPSWHPDNAAREVYSRGAPPAAQSFQHELQGMMLPPNPPAPYMQNNFGMVGGMGGMAGMGAPDMAVGFYGGPGDGDPQYWQQMQAPTGMDHPDDLGEDFNGGHGHEMGPQ
ncbi:hypothetical protein YB2330_004731 [Saitoella coloradoensis]